jgi:hypothetical protein
MANVRLMPPNNTAMTMVVNGRSYTCAAGATIDVPDFDAAVLRANGWVETASAVGATSARPTAPRHGQKYHDTTLGYSVIYDGKNWRNPSTGAVV